MLMLTLFTKVAIGQEIDKYPADKEKLKIYELDKVTQLNIIEEVDSHLMTTGTADSISSERSSVSIPVRIKVRLDPEELHSYIPEVIYEYPDGKLVIDYESLIAIIFSAYAEDQKKIKDLEQEVEKLKVKIK